MSVTPGPQQNRPGNGAKMPPGQATEPVASRDDYLGVVQKLFDSERQAVAGIEEIKRIAEELLQKGQEAEEEAGAAALASTMNCLRCWGEDFPPELIRETKEFFFTTTSIHCVTAEGTTAVPFAEPLKAQLDLSREAIKTEFNGIISVGESIFRSFWNEEALERRKQAVVAKYGQGEIATEPSHQVIDIATGENLSFVLKVLETALKSGERVAALDNAGVLFTPYGVLVIDASLEQHQFFTYTPQALKAVAKNLKGIRSWQGMEMSESAKGRLHDFNDQVIETFDLVLTRYLAQQKAENLPELESRAAELSRKHEVQICLATVRKSTFRPSAKFSQRELDLVDRYLEAVSGSILKFIKRVSKVGVPQGKGITKLKDDWRQNMQARSMSVWGGASGGKPFQINPFVSPGTIKELDLDQVDLDALAGDFERYYKIKLASQAQSLFRDLPHETKEEYMGVITSNAEKAADALTVLQDKGWEMLENLAKTDFAKSVVAYQSALNHNLSPELDPARQAFMERIFGTRGLGASETPLLE